MEYQNQREAFRQLLIQNTDESVAKLKQAEVKEIAEEFEEELLESELCEPAPAKKSKKACLPLPECDDVISWDLEVKIPLSRFKDKEWLFKEPEKTITISFGRNHPDIGVDLSDPNAGPMRRLEKLMAYYHVPGNSLYFRSNNAGNTRTMAGQFLHLYAYFYRNRYLLLDAEGNYKTLETVDVETMRAEVLARMQRGEGQQSTSNFAYAIGRWILISKLALLPKEFIAPFNGKNFWRQRIQQGSRTIQG